MYFDVNAWFEKKKTNYLSEKKIVKNNFFSSYYTGSSLNQTRYFFKHIYQIIATRMRTNTLLSRCLRKRTLLRIHHIIDARKGIKRGGDKYEWGGEYESKWGPLEEREAKWKEEGKARGILARTKAGRYCVEARALIRWGCKRFRCTASHELPVLYTFQPTAGGRHKLLKSDGPILGRKIDRGPRRLLSVLYSLFRPQAGGPVSPRVPLPDAPLCMRKHSRNERR